MGCTIRSDRSSAERKNSLNLEQYETKFHRDCTIRSDGSSAERKNSLNLEKYETKVHRDNTIRSDGSSVSATLERSFSRLRSLSSFAKELSVATAEHGARLNSLC